MPPAVKVVNAGSDLIGATAQTLTSVAHLFANLAVHKLWPLAPRSHILRHPMRMS